MKVLTVQQPWAWAIVHGGKTVENRSWSTAYRGPVAIHAGRTIDPGGFYAAAVIAAGGRSAVMQFGALLGVVDLVDAHRASPADRLDGSEGCCCEPWGRCGATHLALDVARPLPEPIETRGTLGLRDLAPDLTAAVAAALRGAR